MSQRIGTTDVVVTYHRPAVKGRTVWGDLVPYGEVWRLGANEATTISFSDPVRVAGREVPAGSYALFAIPGPEQWTFILNRRARQWGAFSYDPAQDLVRFTAVPAPATPSEWLTFTITPTAADAAEVALAWGSVRVAFPVTVEVERLVWEDLDEALSQAGPGDGDLYLQAARYARATGHRLEQARRWIELSIAAGETWWNLETQADLLHDGGRTAAAIPVLERALALSRGKTPRVYQEGLEKKLAEYRAAAAAPPTP